MRGGRDKGQRERGRRKGEQERRAREWGRVPLCSAFVGRRRAWKAWLMGGGARWHERGDVRWGVLGSSGKTGGDQVGFTSRDSSDLDGAKIASSIVISSYSHHGLHGL